jgi:hypothetical protein
MSFTKIPIAPFRLRERSVDDILPNSYNVNFNNVNSEIKKLKNEVVMLKEQIKLLTELILMERNRDDMYKMDKNDNKYNNDRNIYGKYMVYILPIPLYFLYKTICK